MSDFAKAKSELKRLTAKLKAERRAFDEACKSAAQSVAIDDFTRKAITRAGITYSTLKHRVDDARDRFVDAALALSDDDGDGPVKKRKPPTSGIASFSSASAAATTTQATTAAAAAASDVKKYNLLNPGMRKKLKSDFVTRYESLLTGAPDAPIATHIDACTEYIAKKYGCSPRSWALMRWARAIDEKRNGGGGGGGGGGGAIISDDSSDSDDDVVDRPMLTVVDGK
jgi:hypothetical protein